MFKQNDRRKVDNIPTPHLEADPSQISDKILLPGDPLRAKTIAEKYFTDIVQFNSVRNMLGFTGTYKGERVSVMGTGMGMPSVGIYVNELIDHFGAKKLMRIGTIGGFQDDMSIGDIIIAEGACTDSSFANQYRLNGVFSAIADFEMLMNAVVVAADTLKEDETSPKLYVGNILSTDVFYSHSPYEWRKWAKMGVLGTEMESYALYCIAAVKKVQALSICTVSDVFATDLSSSSEERQEGFMSMTELALDTIIS